jgi:hypothetical protein
LEEECPEDKVFHLYSVIELKQKVYDHSLILNRHGIKNEIVHHPKNVECNECYELRIEFD